jgi:hypothetical protein
VRKGGGSLKYFKDVQFEDEQVPEDSTGYKRYDTPEEMFDDLFGDSTADDGTKYITFHPFYRDQFDGYDYTELAEKWQIPIPDNIWEKEDGSPFSEAHHYIVEYLRRFCKFNGKNNEASRVTRKITKDIREFCKALSEFWGEENDEGLLWEAISKMKDDFTVLRMFTPLVPYAWN